MQATNRSDFCTPMGCKHGQTKKTREGVSHGGDSIHILRPNFSNPFFGQDYWEACKVLSCSFLVRLNLFQLHLIYI